MVAADRGKKSKVVDGDADHFDGEVLVSIEKLQEVQDELEKGLKMVLNADNLPMLNATEHEVAIHTIWERFYDVQDELDKVNEEASDKVLEVEQEYNKIRRPVYVRRNEIIKTIPDFWLTAFLSHPALGDLLSEEDQQIFRHLEFLDVEDFKDVKSGYSITFAFKSNPYFEDAKLTKTFTFFDDGAAKITGTNIKWKEGMGPTNGVNNDKKGNKRPPSDESFFTWFSETQQKDAIDGLHDEVAELIKEDLWPNPLKFFNNEADEEDSDEEDDDEDNDDDAEEEDDDDDGDGDGDE